MSHHLVHHLVSSSKSYDSETHYTNYKIIQHQDVTTSSNITTHHLKMFSINTSTQHIMLHRLVNHLVVHSA